MTNRRINNSEQEIKQALIAGSKVIVYGDTVTLENNVLWVNHNNGSGYKATYVDINRMIIIEVVR